MMTGTAGTSRSRLRLETMWNSPVSTGWWTTRRWCCEMAEVDALSSPHVLLLSDHLFSHPTPPPPTPCLLCPVFVSVVAFLPQDDKISLVKQHRQKELELRRKTYGQVLQALVCVHWCVRPCSTINEYLNAAFSDGRSGSQASR